MSLLPIFVAIDSNKNANRITTSTSVQVSAPPVAQAASQPEQPLTETAVLRPATRKVTARGAFSTPSILDALRDEQVGEVSEYVAESNGPQYVKSIKEKSFNQQELLLAWKDFVVGITDAPQLKSALGAREPVLINQWQIEYVLDTELQFDRLTLDLKPKLLGFLRRQLENELIEIIFSVSAETNQQSNVPYTDEEKWNLLVSKNPSLAGLKSKFGLDFEHY